MAPDRLALWEKNRAANGDFEPELQLYLRPGGGSGGIVLILPGGGYELRADHEGEPVARRFNELGVHAAVLQYRVAPRVYPDPQLDALRAVQMLRLIGKHGGILPDKIAVLGFSAGGHLAACAGTLAGKIDIVANDEADKMPSRPDALILCYPVISSGPCGHRSSFDKLLGTPAETELRKFLSLENRVSAETPPAFLWHTAEDDTVPMRNSLLFAEAMRRHDRPVELHIFPEGRHGIGLADGYSAHIWPELAAQFLKRLDFQGDLS